MLTNNDIIRKLRYAYDFNNKQMLQLFKDAEYEASMEQIVAWTKKDDAEGFKEMTDSELAAFLDGFINSRRGKKEGYTFTETKLIDNNTKFRKLKIALNFKDNDILDTLELAGKRIGKSELSAFFRKPGHKHYMECQDQILRNFLKGLALKEGRK